MNAIYDMNGLARPNEVGKDIGFVTVIYPDEHVVAYAPDVYKKENTESADFNNTAISCQNQDKDLSVPNKDELLSMAYNGGLLGIINGYWSSSDAAGDEGWYQNFNDGYRMRYAKSRALSVRCIKR